MTNFPAGHQQNLIPNPFADHSSPAFPPANLMLSNGSGSGAGWGSCFASGFGSVLVFLDSASCSTVFFLAGPLPSAGAPVFKAEITTGQSAGAPVFGEENSPDASAGAAVF